MVANLFSKTKIIAFSVFTIFLCCCTATQRRVLVRWDASVKDYLYFPNRDIKSGTFVREFERKPSEEIEAALSKSFGSENLQAMVDKTKTQALIVVKDETILLEKYGKGYDAHSTVTSFSVAKSIVSAIIGALIDEGKIKSVDESICTFLPELHDRDERFEKITIKHLLSMSSGIVYEETFPRKDNTETYFNPNLRNLALTNTVIKEESGLHFLYNNYNPLLLGLIIERCTGEHVSSYCSRAIWSKIGAQEKATWSLDSEGSGFEKMESGINATALDFLRFGCLYRDGGKINGKTVISKNWLEESLREDEQNSDYINEDWGKRIAQGVSSEGGYYGYFWYIIKRSKGENDFFAFGNKGQVIYISPSANLVCVRFGEKDGLPVWDYIKAFYDLGTKVITHQTQ